MSKFQSFLFVLVLIVVGFSCYKLGDKYGFEAGQKYGYGLDCRDDLENIKALMNKMEIALQSARKAAWKYDDELKSERELQRARKYNELRSKMLKASPDDVLLNAIESYDDKGNPKFDEKYMECLAGIGSCKGYAINGDK